MATKKGGKKAAKKAAPKKKAAKKQPRRDSFEPEVQQTFTGAHPDPKVHGTQRNESSRSSSFLWFLRLLAANIVNHSVTACGARL
jgi:hypothetical protein